MVNNDSIAYTASAYETLSWKRYLSMKRLPAGSIYSHVVCVYLLGLGFYNNADVLMVYLSLKANQSKISSSAKLLII